jgi:hypothetical protein
MSCALRQRVPLAPQDYYVVREWLANAYDACDDGGPEDLAALAGMLGRLLATPFYDDRERKAHGARLRPAVYDVGARAGLLAACARVGLDPEPYTRLMEEARDAEAAIPAGR